MSPEDKKKLERVARELTVALNTVRDMLDDGDDAAEREPVVAFDAKGQLARIRALDRSDAEKALAHLKQSELGSLFCEAGGPSADRKKPKVWLTEQILWRLYDFQRGHEAIRGGGEGRHT